MASKYPYVNQYAGLKVAKRKRPDAPATTTDSPSTASDAAKRIKRESETDRSNPSNASNAASTSTSTPANPTPLFAPLSSRRNVGRRRNDPTRRIALELTLCREEIERVFNKKAKTLHELRDRIRRLPWLPLLTKELVDESRLLSVFLPKVVDAPEKIIEWDIRLDAQEVINKWAMGDFDDDPERGVNVGASGKGRGRNHNYQFSKSCNVKGHNGLVVGQWWPLQICAARDGAHGEMEAGIHGTKENGALSVVMSGGSDSTGASYEDDDLGSSLFYCGTRNLKGDGTPTRGTTFMLAAEAEKSVVRVLRSAKCTSQYAPTDGIRYDGLYRVTGKIAIGPPEEAHFRFTLDRLEGQPPIRRKDGDDETRARPTKYEKNWRAGAGCILGFF